MSFRIVNRLSEEPERVKLAVQTFGVELAARCVAELWIRTQGKNIC